MTPATFNLCLFLGRHESCSSGLWVYGRSLLEALLGQDSSRVKLDSVALGDEKELKNDFEQLRSRHAVVPFKSLFLSSSALGRRLAMFSDLLFCRSQAELVHGTANLVPIFGSAKKVVTLHDLLQAFPDPAPKDLYRKIRSLWYRSLFRFMLSRVDLIITDLDQTRDEIRRRFAPGAPIEVVYPGLAKQYVEAPITVRDRSQDSKYRFLAFASRDPRKNVESVISAISTMRATGKQVELTVIASSETMKTQVWSLVEREQLTDVAKLRAGVPADDMPALYASHDALLFPSRAEGFGYPVYEGLSQGVPVVCRGSVLLPELQHAQQLVFSCDPQSPDSVLEACRKLMETYPSTDSARRAAEEVRELLDFSAVAKRMLHLYEQVANTPV